MFSPQLSDNVQMIPVSSVHLQCSLWDRLVDYNIYLDGFNLISVLCVCYGADHKQSIITNLLDGEFILW